VAAPAIIALGCLCHQLWPSVSFWWEGAGHGGLLEALEGARGARRQQLCLGRCVPRGLTGCARALAGCGRPNRRPWLLRCCASWRAAAHTRQVLQLHLHGLGEGNPNCKAGTRSVVWKSVSGWSHDARRMDGPEVCPRTCPHACARPAPPSRAGRALQASVRGCLAPSVWLAPGEGLGAGDLGLRGWVGPQRRVGVVGAGVITARLPAECSPPLPDARARRAGHFSLPSSSCALDRHRCASSHTAHQTNADAAGSPPGRARPVQARMRPPRCRGAPCERVRAR